MKKKIWRLTVRSEFSAGHALRHYEGKCENVHGHNFGVEVTVQGEKLHEKVEYLLDFKQIKNNLKVVLEGLDHKVLNNTPPFDVINPTSENLAQYIWQQLDAVFTDETASVYSVSVSEKSAQTATYLEIEA